MNIRNLRLILLLLLMAAAASVNAQNSLTLQQLNNFPDLPADTAFEGFPYTYDVVVQNNTNSVLVGNLQVYMQVDTIQFQIGSPATQVNMNPGDTVVLTVAGFNFTPAQFKSGNNIVVVWPVVSSGITYNTDSLTTEVFFVPLNSTGITYAQSSEFTLFPNPVNDFLRWKNTDGIVPERVRIYDTQGRLITDFGQASQLSVSYLPSGVYFIELKFGDTIVRERFAKW